MPNCALVGEIRVIEETIAGFTVADHATCVVPEWIVLKFLVAPDVLPSV